MKKRSILPIALTALVGLTLSFASTAMASPGESSPCSDCHSGVNVPITAAVNSTAGGNTTYDIVTMGADAVAVFDGGTKLYTIQATSGQFTVADGKTYTLFAVAGPGEGDGLGTMDVSPVSTPGDTTAPSTISDAKSTYVSEATIALTATDNTGGSGVAHTYYVLDGAAQAEGTSASITTTGTHTIAFWSVDAAGNIEPRNSATFDVTTPAQLDTTAPSTISDAKTTYVSEATIALTATDNTGGSGVAHTYYVLDGAAQAEGTSASITTTGTHTIAFWSVDAAGNIEPRNSATFDVTTPAQLDTTAPSTISDAKTTYVSEATIALTATDNTGGSGVAHTYYVLDGAAQAEGTSASITTTGTHTIAFWSVDAAGNIEPRNSATFDVTTPAQLDTTAPSTISDAKSTYVSEATIALTATDNTGGSGVAHTYYVLDGAAQAEGTSASITTTGTHTIAFWSVDAAGNIEPRNSATFDVTDATTPPVVKTRSVHVHVNLRHSHARDLTATLTDKTTGATFTSTVDRRGNIAFKNVPNGTYRLTISGSTFEFAARTVYVGPHDSHHAHQGHGGHSVHHKHDNGHKGHSSK